MATPVIKLRRSATQSAVPTTAQLALGEVAINTFDGKLFIKKDNGTESIVEIGAGSGGGISNVVEDTTPQLGGDLDLNGNDITGTGNATISTSAGVLSLTASGVGGKVNINGVAGNEINSGTGALQAGIFSGKEAGTYTQNGSDLTVRGGNAFDAVGNTNTVQGGHLYLTGGVAGGGGEGVGVANGGSVYIDGGPLAGTGSNGNVLIGTARTTFVGIGTSNPDALSPLKIAQTWDASTSVVTGIALNVTDTSSNASSKLLDLKIGADTSFYVGKSGRFGGNSAAFQMSQAGGWHTLKLDPFVGGNGLQISGASNTVLNLGNMNATGPGLTLFSGNYISWTTTNSTYLYGNISSVLEQRRATNAQTFRIYNTWTNSTDDFERAQIGWTTNTLIVGTEKGSAGGTARPLHLQTDGTTRVAVTTDGKVGIGLTEPTEELEVSGDIKATSFIKSGGTASQYLMADGSVTSTTVEHKILDDISGSFNGSTTSFTLSSSSTNFINSEITSAARLMISVGGIVQQPDPTQTNGFYISGGTNISTDPIVINFVEAPKAGQDFFGVAYGLAISPSAAFVTEEQSIVNSIVFGV